jgi:homogentisate phytyltransferase / homogentisate geranylgeranyltransferase
VRLLVDLLRLGRWEGPVLGAVLVPVGWVLAGGPMPPGARVLVAMLLLGPGALGFVYGLNGITDVVEDRVTKPHRPLAAGRVPPALARAWVTALGVGAPLGTWLAFGPGILLWLVFGLIVLGVLYSAPPLRLKRFPPAATVTITLLLHAPLIAGASLTGAAPPSWLLASAGLCVALLPLKDIEDEAGDSAAGLGNWASWIGVRRLLLVSTGAVALFGAFAAHALAGETRLAVLGAYGVALLTLLWHLGPAARVDRLYRRLVRTILVLAAALPLLAWLLN